MRPIPLHVRAAAVAALAVLGCAAGPRGKAKVAPVRAELATRLSAAVDPVNAAGTDAFVSLGAVADLGSVVAPDVEAWWRRFFRPEALPTRGAGMTISARPALDELPDLVRTEYEMAVLRIEVVDSAAWTLVRVADPGSDLARGAAAEVIARHILAVGPDRRWDVALPPRLVEGTWYTSNADVEPGTMMSWRDRLDVRVQGGRVELLCHKRGEGAVAADATAWFPPDLRTKVEPPRWRRHR